MSAKYRATLLVFLAYFSLQVGSIPTVSFMEKTSQESPAPNPSVEEVVRYSAPYKVERPKSAPSEWGGGGDGPVPWA